MWPRVVPIRRAFDSQVLWAFWIAQLRAWLGQSGDSLAAGHLEQAIPFFAGQLQVRGPGGLANAFGIGAADDRNYSRRMFEEPCEGDDAASRTAALRDQVQFRHDRRWPIDFLRWQQAARAAAQLAASQRTPGEWRDVIGQT